MRKKRNKETKNNISFVQPIEETIKNISQKEEKKIINAISVIIPVKDRTENTKKLIEELILQKNKYYPETEIIIVENNSCEDMSFLDNYQDIIVLHETKPGVSNARNKGLEVAHGEYIAFIDNDDFIIRKYLHILYQTMRKTNCDWCAFPWYVDEKPIELKIDINDPLKTSWSVWAYCFNQRIINNIKFDTNLNVGEDIEWIHKVITKNTKGVKIDSPIYYFTWENNNDSLSHQFNRGELLKINKITSYKYIIMAAGAGTRWNNYLGVPKHLIEINGETLLERTTRLLKENGVTDYIITTSNEEYAKYGPITPQTRHDCEVDRFEENFTNENICYLYGDVYYSEKAIKEIVNTEPEDILFFGHEYEIFGIKIKNKKLFFAHKNKVKELYLKGEIGRCIGWEVYRSLNNIPFEEHIITDRYIKILDGTDDIDYPQDYEDFKHRMEAIKDENN